MDQTTKAEAFRAAHVPGAPLVLYNIWDAGGARTLARAGAPAIATGSWAVAAAHGFKDGENLPLDMLLWIVGRIVASVDLPVSVDFEGGFAAEPEAVAANVTQLIGTGAIGINFEDRVVAGQGLYPVAQQAERIAAIRAAARAADMPLVINARTDLFYDGSDPAGFAARIPEALDRAAAYAEAGADCLFVPGLTGGDEITQMVEKAPLPINVMMEPGFDTPADAAALGVARVSFGGMPYARAQSNLAKRFSQLA